MRRNRLAVVVALAAVTACSAPAQAAVPTDIRVDVDGPLAFHGTGDGSVSWVGALRESRLGHAPLEGAIEVDGQAQQLNFTYLVESAPAGAPTGYSHKQVPLSRSAWSLGPVHGPLRLLEAGGNASVRLLPAGPVAVPITSSFALDPPRDVGVGLEQDRDPVPRDAAAAYYPAPGGLLHGPVLAVPAFAGRLVLSDYRVAGPGLADLDERWQQDLAGLPSTAGTPGATLLTTHLLVVEGTIAPLDLAPDSWMLAVDRAQGRLDGDLLLQNVRGSGTLNGTPIPEETRLLEAKGTFLLDADYHAAPATLAFTGQSTFLAANARPVLAAPAAAGAVVAGGLAVVVALALAKWGRPLVALLPGLHRAEPLRSPKRVEVLRLVTAMPGVDQSELAAAAGIGRGTVRHHLRVLLRADLLTERRQGARATYTLNDRSYEFPATPVAGSWVAGQALALLRNPHRRRLVEALRESGEAGYGDLVGRCNAAGLATTRDDVRYHLQVLERAGMVARRSEGRNVLWSARIDVAAVADRQRNRFLSGRLGSVVEALDHGPSPLAAVQSRLRSRGVAEPRRAVAAKLDLLAATGHVERAADGYRLRRGAS